MKIVVAYFLLLSLAFSCSAQTREQKREATRLNNEAVTLGERNRGSREDIAQAIGLLKTAWRIDPYSETIANNLATMLEQQNQLEEALTIIDTFLTRVPSSRRTRSKRAFILALMRLNAEAEVQRLQLMAEGIDDNYGVLPKESPLAPVFSYFKLGTQNKNEFGLRGIFRQANKTFLEFDALVFALPNGRFQVMAPKRKQVFLNGVEPEHSKLGTIPVNQLKYGDLVSIIGEEKQGKFVARAILADSRTPKEAEKRGTLFDTQKLDMKEDQNFPENLKGIGTASFVLKNGKSESSQTSTFIRDGNKVALVTSASAFELDNSRYRNKSVAVFGAETVKKLITTQVVNGLADLDDYYSEEKQRLPKLDVKLPLRISKPYPGGELIVTETNTKPDSLKLAAQNPVRGQNVFYAIYNEGAVEWLDAIVAHSDANRVILHLLGSPDGDFISGYPIVNHAGEVVGLQISTDEIDVSGVSVEALRRAIHQPTKQAPPAKTTR